MNKYDIINKILNNLDRTTVTGVANAQLLLDSVQNLQLLAQVLAKEDEEKAKKEEPADDKPKIEPVSTEE